VSRWQLIVLSVLWLLPIAVLVGFGAWSLYESGRWFWLWWTLPVCWGLCGWLWRRWGRQVSIPVPELDQTHWTPRDQAAWEIVAAEQRRIDELTAEQLIDPQFYVRTTQELAQKIAAHYHPGARDPVGSLSVVEILAAIDLITEDMEDWFLRYVPGSHLITVAQWRLLSKAPRWWNTAVNAGWVVSIAVNPLNLGRFLASKLAVEPLTRLVQQNLLGTFYALYLRQAGHYLIELNSGRLKGGSKRYREVMRRLHGDVHPGTASGESPPPEPVTITIAVIGQVKAGKSSLINGLLGGQQAAVDILPTTAAVQRYRLDWPDRSETLVLLDTPGYSDAGASEAQRRETRAAVRQADVVLLVLDARSPARDADLAVVDDLQHWFQQQPQLKPPAIIAVLNKVDGLSPVLEWSPPYDWRQPVRPKEQAIAGAVAYTREVLGTRIANVVPTCADLAHGRVFGITEFLMPAIADTLASARAAALVRSLHGTFDHNQLRHMVDQVLAAGKKLTEVLRPP
jgi:small GTP-binding protein